MDAHAIGEHATGNERFISNVLREMRGLSDHDFVLFFTEESAASEWERAGWDVRLMRPRHPAVRIPLVLPRLARAESLDVLLVQYTAPRSPGCPVVTVVHDVSFAEHPEWFPQGQRRWMPRTIPATMNRAARVVTVSEFSRDEIRRIYRIPEERIVVAHDGVDPRLSEPQDPPVPEPYLLYVGNIEARKNLAVLLGAFRRARDAGLDHRLVIAGKGPAPKVEGVDALGWVDDDTLAGLLQHATALCYPSRYEGFGLPPVEAMSVGTPVLVSDIPVMREVVGDAGILLGVEDERGWAEAMLSVCSDADRRAELSRLGQLRAARFTWNETAEKILAALEAAVVAFRD